MMPPLDHPVEIAGPRLHRLVGLDRELFALGRLWRRQRLTRSPNRACEQGAGNGRAGEQQSRGGPANAAVALPQDVASQS